MARSQTPIETPLAQRVEDFRHRTLPMVVWGAAALIVVALLLGRARQVDYIGIAHAPEYEVSVANSGTIETVVVDLYDSVEPGDVVATLDDDQVLAEIEAARASVRLLQAQFEVERDRLTKGTDERTADWTADLRRFQIDEESRRLEILSLKVVIESDRIELERLALELRRAVRLVEDGLIPDTDYDNVRAARDHVRKRIDENEILMSQLGEEYLTAQNRRRNYEEHLPAGRTAAKSVLRPLVEAVRVESERLKEIEIQRSELVLRSPVIGQVSQMLCRTGQSVIPGEPIMMIAERSVREIVAYLSESDGRRITLDTPVMVTSRNQPGMTAESVVVRVGPTIQALPQRLWRDPALPDYGRAVVIAAAPAMALTPGELVDVEFLGN